MGFSNKGSIGLVVGSVVLATGGYIAFKRYRDYRELLDDLSAVPWDVPSEYKSWKRFFADVSHKSGIDCPLTTKNRYLIFSTLFMS